ncbi:very short patch repair endonuclease [Varunaivibrio sulfuroxidans]|nr:DNA mismatch endonuclease Vsr [Varunaivibrio sulfuroxidans]WES32188.1 DNA mismatch endonuclease Vsr [Varunaivibrio sulfuroxidans]
MTVRRLIYSLGYRYRLHRKDLPGTPDLVFPGRRAVIFVHGCFWHGHDCKRGARTPKSNTGYWKVKIARNVERDAKTIDDLERNAWRVLVVWECELKDAGTLHDKLDAFLTSRP